MLHISHIHFDYCVFSIKKKPLWTRATIVKVVTGIKDMYDLTLASVNAAFFTSDL